MSFSAQVKNELSRIIPEEKACQLSELSGFVRMSGSLSLMGFNKLAFNVGTDHPSIIRKVFTLFKACFDIQAEVQAKKNNNLKKNHTYYAHIRFEQGANDILEALQIIERKGEHLHIISKIPESIRNDEERRRAYIRGAFLGGGSVSDPEKAYHMEFAALDEEWSEQLMQLLNEYGFNAKIIRRKNSYVIYIKESSNISDVLNIMGAHHALLRMEDIRIMKQVRNDVNRIVNCETANLSRTVSASTRQIESIRYIRDTVGLESLSDNLHEIAALRLEYEEASLKELGEMLSKPIGRSGVNHRLKKLESMALELKEGRTSNDC